MSRTTDALREAIAGEYNAMEKYLKYAEIADAEKFTNIAYLFRALAKAEEFHLKNHRKALGEDFQPLKKDVKPTTLQGAVQEGLDGETWEFTSMYPDLMKSLKKESKLEMAKLALVSMEWAKNVEKGHAALFTQALTDLQSGKDINITQIWVCKVCGNLVIGDKPTEMCPVCKHDPIFYELVPR